MDAEEAKDCNVVAHVLKDGNSEHRVLIECDKLATNSILVRKKKLEYFRLFDLISNYV